MAKSKIQFIDSLIQEVTKLSMTDDNALMSAREWIGDKLDGYRATVLRKYIAEKNDLSSCYQEIRCLKSECLGIECVIDDIEFKMDADLYKVEIPELLGATKAIKYFGSFDFKRPYGYRALFSLTESKDRWGRNQYSFARIGNTLYYQRFDGQREFILVGIFANPSDVCGFNDASPYPLPKELEQQLELLVKKDLYQMLGLPIDFLNDSADSAPQPKQDERRQQ